MQYVGPVVKAREDGCFGLCRLAWVSLSVTCRSAALSRSAHSELYHLDAGVKSEHFPERPNLLSTSCAGW